ncbi:MAG: peptide ABC transporter substrate-binding protein [bacterium]|nr:peptide ABC transporter substrate-binding protein [bacterium]
MNDETREKLTRIRKIPSLDRLMVHIDTFSSGDKFLFYLLSILVVIASISGFYALEKSLLVEVPAYGGVLVEGVIGSPRFINPLLAISDADRDLSALTYAGLMGLSSTGELVPVLAENYELSEDGKTYTFTLRENAKFSDGSPITSDDVIFTVKKAQSPALKSPKYADWSGVNVVAVDQRTIRFTLPKQYAPFLGITTLGILPSRLWNKVSDEEFPFSILQTNPVGAGPFKVTNVSRGVSGLIESLYLSENSNYALGRPYLDGIRFNFYSRAEDLSNAIQSGSVKSAYDLPIDRSGSKTMTATYARVFGVFWNPSEKQVYAREEVRKALSLSLDRQFIINNVLGSYATAIMGPVPPGGSVQQTSVQQFENRTESAAEVLTSSGWKYDGLERVWVNASAKQTLDGITLRTSNVPELKNVASAVKSDWEELGIPVSIELYEPGDLSQNVIRPRKYEALLYGMVIGRDQDLYAFWSSQERNDPGLNIALYANKTVDTLLENVRRSSDKKTRADNLQKIEDTIAADYPAAFIYSPNFTYSIPSNLQGVELPQIIIPADRFASVESWYSVTDAVWPIFVNKNR